MTTLDVALLFQHNMGNFWIDEEAGCCYHDLPDRDVHFCCIHGHLDEEAGCYVSTC